LRRAVIVLVLLNVLLIVASWTAAVVGLLVFGIPTVTIVLRYFGRAPRFTRALYLVSSVVGWFFVGIEGIMLCFDAQARSAPLFVLFVLELAYMTYFAALWHKLKLSSVERLTRRQAKAEASLTVPPAIYQTRVHGAPGAGLVDGLNRFGENNVSLGMLGEQITATLLEEFLAIPSVQVIHGLRFPGTKNSDIDHAVIAGNRVALIDSKLWSSGSYELDRVGRILENGRMNKRHNSHHPTAVDRMSVKHPNMEIRGWIVVHPQDRNLSLARTANPGARTRLVTADSLMSEVGEWLAESGETVDVFVLRDLIAERNW
jgi:hypothetical protein